MSDCVICGSPNDEEGDCTEDCDHTHDDQLTYFTGAIKGSSLDEPGVKKLIERGAVQDG